MMEENKELENSEVVRELVVPSAQQSGEEDGDRSPTKTERDILSDPEPEAGQQPDAIRDLVKPSADEGATSDDDRSPGRTEK
ncbi:hypothetical protein VB780_24620 [Leptolyngbya sp. CCNP1308]|uniref:hypothetical protein n=1 Tax=Leptolyngbya sp. CCNP1308 TaxID=3110255 RepID=UPI002B1FD60A|nr:hypothetical protein [Leptolyngbya sp. CCNP1308]MEA5451784.1 hypothetical protein [Leptolyngbya sp. CCNP1308]